MKKFILTLFTISTVLLAQAQARTSVVGPVQPAEKAVGVIQDEEELAIYPNPSNGVFTISVSNLPAKKAELRIINVIGNEIYHETLTRGEGVFTKTIDLSGKAKGLYYVKLETDTYSSVRRVVIK
ncbi:T9SS type A sorting domain-containing protein [uncultured Pontibacter sp.]|uniref:T9SS type A sorting domain-containing protein n=1 Tax=uncultured Pontibacter sp. TaxID=453356 RepID=UPI002616F0F9|nr:T9SS type A sorting domain-containing protein [uncultured Pontibacter sp.]